MDVIINCRYYIHSWQYLISMLKLQLRWMLGPTHKFLSKYMARWALQHNCFWIINPEMTSKEGRKYNVLVDTSTVGGVGGCFLSKFTAAEADDQSLRSLQPIPPSFVFVFLFFCFFVFCLFFVCFVFFKSYESRSQQLTYFS